MSSTARSFADWRRVVCLSLLLVPVGAGAGLAQSTLGAITGIITDPQGAVVAEAPITATNVATGLRTSTKSNSAGIYLLASLPIGIYTVSVEHPGFGPYV